MFWSVENAANELYLMLELSSHINREAISPLERIVRETLIYLRCLRQGPSPSERFDEAADTVGV